MSDRNNIDDVLRNWEFQPDLLSVRLMKGGDGRDVIQMRVDLGVLQMETTGRPDGLRPEGYRDYLTFLSSLESDDEEFELTEEQCVEADREFVQFYHRRISWLRLQRYELAIADADHTLSLMDICRDHSPDEDWTMGHEQYRPFVLFHRTQAAALQALDNDEHDRAIHEIDAGLEEIREVFEEHGVADTFEEDEMVMKLRELSEKLETEYTHKRPVSLQQQLALAVQLEQYELAARLRDELARKYNG
jgi:hypothetical protein